MKPPLSDETLHHLALRFEGAHRAIGGFAYGQWAVIRDLRVAGDMNDVLYRGPVMDRNAYHRELLIARMRYALEILQIMPDPDASHEPARDRLPDPLTNDGEVVAW